jgi:hypothetical protein
MYVVLEGTAIVTIQPDQGPEREGRASLTRRVLRRDGSLDRGTSQPPASRPADDLAVLVIHKRSLQATLSRRPGLVQEMA